MSMAAVRIESRQDNLLDFAGSSVFDHQVMARGFLEIWSELLQHLNGKPHTAAPSCRKP